MDDKKEIKLTEDIKQLQPDCNKKNKFMTATNITAIRGKMVVQNII